MLKSYIFRIFQKISYHSLIQSVYQSKTSTQYYYWARQPIRDMGDNTKQISFSSAAQFRLCKKMSINDSKLKPTPNKPSEEDSNNPETLKRLFSMSTQILNCVMRSIIDDTEQYYLDSVRRDRLNPNSPFTKHITSSFKFLKMFSDVPVRKQAETLNMPQTKKYHNKKTLLLDLDETIIHSTKDENVACDLRVLMNFPGGKIINAGVYIRPYALQMLSNISKYFQIIIFTASHPFYADPILDALDPQGQLFSYRLYRQHCIQLNKDVFAKDLRIIPRNLSQMVIVDNSPVSYILQPQNGIPITSFYTQHDTELKGLEEYLMKLVYLVDVKNMNSRTFKFDKYKNYADVDDLILALYPSA